MDFLRVHQGWQAVYVDHQGISKDLLKEKLDWGEIESIQLAMDMKDAVLLIDDEEAREVARKQGLRTKGTVGVLVEAFQKRFIEQYGRRASGRPSKGGQV